MYPEEVEVIQYLHPSGKRRRMAVAVGLDFVKKASAMILESETVENTVTLYGRFVGQSEEEQLIKIATNGPGEKNPQTMMKKLIEELDQRKTRKA